MTTARALVATAAIAAAVCVSSLAIAGALAERDPDRAPITRTIAWEGGDSLTIGVPAQVRYVQAPGPGTVRVTGPRRSVETFHATDGVLQDGTWRTSEVLSIVVTAPNVTRFTAKGRDRLAIEGFDHEVLRIEATGSAEVIASGRARTVHLDLAGSGWADLSRVDTQAAEIALSLLRHAIVTPVARATISGSGTVVLLSTPPTLALHLQGAGRVIHARPPSPN